MSGKDLFVKTMPFVWAKLLLGAAVIGGSLLLLAVCLGIGALTKGAGLGFLIVFWVLATSVLNVALNHYIGYLVKAGHIAVLVEASVTGAVKQLQNVVGKVGSLLSSIPGMGLITSGAQFFVGVALGYIDECCLGWTFYNEQDGAWKSAADGVVIYARNAKKLVGSALKITLKAMLACVLIWVIMYVFILAIFGVFHIPTIISFVLTCFVMWSLKVAFLDSWVMTQMIASYMALAPQTEITYDLYGKLCGVSCKFKELFDRGSLESAPASADLNLFG